MDAKFTASAVEKMCATQTENFKKVDSFPEIAEQTKKLLGECGCAPDGEEEVFLQ